jgi:protein gp37
MAKSKIEWTDRTWNLVTGCTKISPGCKNCYAERMTRRLQAMGQKKYAAGFDKVVCHHEVLQEPLKWRKPSKIFVCSMSDLFHKDVPFTFIMEAVRVMAAAGANGHIFQVLTKRPDIAVEFFEWWGGKLPSNVWFGTTVENQDQDWRIHELLKIPATVRFLSIEPMIGPVDLDRREWMEPADCKIPGDTTPQIDWVIVGGESGPGARSIHLDWVRTIRDQCESAGVPFMFKQWGEWCPCDPTSEEARSTPHSGYTSLIAHTEPKDRHNSYFYKSKNNTMACKSENTLIEEGFAFVARIGKKKAGNLLDGKQHMEFPK